MELTTILRLVAALACPIGMGLMMWLMMKNMNGEQNHSMPDKQTPVTTEKLDALRAKREALEVEIAKAASLAELKTQRKAVPTEKQSTTVARDGAEVPIA